MERIEKLRDRTFAQDRFNADIEFYLSFYKTYDKHTAPSEEERYAEAFYNAFSDLTPAISDDELIVGNRDISLSEKTITEWEQTYKDIAYAYRNKVFCGQDSHMAIDYQLILSHGINGIIEQINSYLETCDLEKANYYRCCKKCLTAIIKHADAYSALALKMSKESKDPARQSELKRISEICKRVPAQPAQNFYEAVQSVHFVTHCLSFNPFRMCAQQFQLGRPDCYLWPFYAKDIKKNSITKEFAQLLLDCLGIQINMRVSNGLSSGYMVGGRNEKGEIISNELTDMCMQVIQDIRLVYPAVGLCYTEGMPEKHLEKACELLLGGHSHPAIFNDDVIAKGLTYYGVQKERAHDYMHSTCVEITPIATSNVWVASPYTNMPQILLDIMDREFGSFEELVKRYFEVLDHKIKINFENETKSRTIRAENTINPLLSCFVHDCLRSGTDIERGGATYNWIMPSFVGISNLIDSLYAIKAIVFEEKRLGICELKAILEKDFKENEALRSYILHNIPKYGNDIDEIDNMYSVFTEHILKECEKYRGPLKNAKLIPSIFCWIMHEHFGRETIATPDGRKSGFPLGDGSGPCQGREMNGPTASILSSTKWEHDKFIGGIAVNLKFSKSSLGENSLNTVKALLKTYLMRGGFEIQINVIDNDTLIKAQQDPEHYRDLVVRIGGYSDYFTRLSHEMQEEVIMRTSHHAS